MTGSTHPGGFLGGHLGDPDAAHPAYRPPRTCPVCGSGLDVTRMGCGSCGSELSGLFEACAFCGLTDTERDLLRVFLVSRGNLREVERHLGVSYPTARQRYAELLARLGLEAAEPAPAAAPATEPPAAPAADAPDQLRVLDRLAAGEIDVETAAEVLNRD